MNSGQKRTDDTCRIMRIRKQFYFQVILWPPNSQFDGKINQLYCNNRVIFYNGRQMNYMAAAT